MSALTIRDDISSKELRRWARQESDSRVSARVIAIANALGGYGSGQRGAAGRGWTARPCVTGFTATTRKGFAGLCNRPARTQVEAERRAMAALKAVVLAGPDPAVGKNRAVAHRRSVP